MNHDPGEGWRLLKIGEARQNGDEVLSHHSWCKWTSGGGWDSEQLSCSNPARRRIQSAKPDPNRDLPAFPYRYEDGAGGYCQFSGLSLRDWFAGQALAGLCANPEMKGSLGEFAADSYRYADAMLAARKEVAK